MRVLVASCRAILGSGESWQHTQGSRSVRTERCGGAQRAPRCSLWRLWAAATARAQAPSHAGQYEQADIEYGAQLYSGHCVVCHGERGDAMPGANLGVGKFRHAETDRDLTNVIRNGVPGTAMAPSAYTESELGRARRLSAQHGQREPRPTSSSATRLAAVAIRRQGRLRPLSPRRGRRAALRAGLDEHRRDLARRPRLQRSLLDPNDGAPADQSPGARGVARRHAHHGPAAQRRHVHGAAHRRARTTGDARQVGDPRVRRQRCGADAVVRNVVERQRNARISSRISCR